MIGRSTLLQRLLLLLPCCLQPALAQAPPPLPALPGSTSPELRSCVASYGHTGCAARLYAQLLCDNVGRFSSTAAMEFKLAEQYEQAGIDFRGITPEQVETAAVRYYSPMLCPQKSRLIRRLFEGS